MTEPTEQEVEQLTLAETCRGTALYVRSYAPLYPPGDAKIISDKLTEAADTLESLSSRLAAERKENGNLRAALRVNGYRAGFTDEQIDKALAAIAESTKG